MPHTFATYTDIALKAFQFNPRHHDTVNKKKEILTSVAKSHGGEPTSTLAFGFSPWLLTGQLNNLYVTEITDSIKSYLNDQNIKYTYVHEDELAGSQQFDWVLAGDEYFTFADSEDDQKKKVTRLSSLTKKILVTTLRDYKNQDYKDREFSHPLAVRNNEAYKLFLEFNDYGYKERDQWKSTVYELDGTSAEVYGYFARRSMYFKQLAKFTMDNGGLNYLIHKNLMYKSLIKKNYEHVISVSF